MMLAIEALIAEHRHAHCPGTCRPALSDRADHARVQLLLAQEPHP